MATCALVGQAVGTAASIAVKGQLSPRGVYQESLQELQQTLMDDDVYLPWHRRKVPELSIHANLKASGGNPESLRSGLDRPIGELDNGWLGVVGDWIVYSFETPKHIQQMRFVFDSNLNRPEHNAHANIPLQIEPVGVPETMVKAFRVESLSTDGEWQNLIHVHNNYQRLVRLEVDVVTRALRFIPESTWGAEQVHLFAWDVSDRSPRVNKKVN
jgi:hypothetical protein